MSITQHMINACGVYPRPMVIMIIGTLRESLNTGKGTPFSVPKSSKSRIMEKKNTSPTVAEQKQILETCVHKLEEVNACILAMYPTLSTNLPLSDYTNEELIAHELCEDIFSDFIRFGHILIEVVRKEVVYEN